MIASKIQIVLAAVLMVAALGSAAGLIYESEASEASPVREAQGPFLKNIEAKPLTKEEKTRILIDNVLAAHGGEEKLRNIQFTLTMDHSNGETQHYLLGPPKCFRWEMTRRDSTRKRITILLEQGREWWYQEQNQKPVHVWLTGMEPPVHYWHKYAKFFGPRRFLMLKDPDSKVNLLDKEIQVDGRPAIGVEVGGIPMYFDKDTFLLSKQGDVTFSKYKTFDGIPIAQEEHDGHFEPRITDFKVVEKFDAKLFEQP